jgi:hypothetical protein
MIDNTTEEYEKMMAEPERLAIFNKITGEFTSITSANSEEYLNSKFWKWRKITINEATQKFVGDYDTGKVVDMTDAPVEVLETQLDEAAGTAIGNEYSWYHQVNVLNAVVKVLIEKNAITGPEVDDFLNVLGYIEDKRESNERYKKAYSEGPDWNYISKKEEAASFKRQLEGGVHEFLGPRNTVVPGGIEEW